MNVIEACLYCQQTKNTCVIIGCKECLINIFIFTFVFIIFYIRFIFLREN